MNNRWSLIIILTFANPHSGEISQTTKNAASNPNTILPFGRSSDFDFRLDIKWSHIGDFFGESFSQSSKHSSATTQYDISKQISFNIGITFTDTQIDHFMYSDAFLANKRWFEQCFWTLYPLFANRYAFSIRKFITTVLLVGFLIRL